MFPSTHEALACHGVPGGWQRAHGPQTRRERRVVDEVVLLQRLLDEQQIEPVEFGQDLGKIDVARIQRDDAGDVLRLDWRVEWVTVAAPGNAARAMAHGEPMPELPGLFA